MLVVAVVAPLLLQVQLHMKRVVTEENIAKAHVLDVINALAVLRPAALKHVAN
jgi:hypothetical protein